MDQEDSELLSIENWAEELKEIKRKAKTESISILAEIQETLSSINIPNLLAQLTHMAFYVREDENVYEHNTAFDLREMPIIHLICGLSLQQKENHNQQDITARDLFDLIRKASAYLFKISPFLNLQDDENDSKTLVIQSHKQTMMMVRPINPERYPHQTEMYVKGLNTRISEIFIDRSGLTPEDFLRIGAKIQKHTLAKVNEIANIRHTNPVIRQFAINPESDKSFIEEISKIVDEKERDEYFDFYVRYLNSSITRDALFFEDNELLDEIDNSEKALLNKYLSICSTEQGNQPIDSNILIDNVLFSKPFIKWGQKYFCPAPADIILSLPAILERILEKDKLSAPPTKIWERYQKAKANFLEDKAQEFFSRIFPKELVFKNIFYEFNGNVEEADLLIPYFDKLIIVQAKSGSLNNAARRGAEKSFKNAVKKLLEEAYQQGVKVRDYIENCSSPIFKFKNGDFAFSPNPESSYLVEYIFINLTLEPLGPVSARIKDLHNIGFFKNNEYPLSMSIHDMDTITSHLPSSPSIFLHYIKQRIIAQNEGVFSFQDELTPFAWYLEVGNFKIPSNVEGEKVTHIGIDPDYLTKFDEFYLRKGEKPRLEIEEEWIKLIMHLEKQSYPDHITITEELLSISQEMRERIIIRMRDAFKKKYKQGVIGIVSLANTNEPTGISFVTYDTTKAKLNHRLDEYSILRKYQGKKNCWIGLAKATKSNGPWWEMTSAKLYKFPWVFDVDLEYISQSFPVKGSS